MADDVTQDGDRDDGAPGVHPGAAEICDGVDQDCVGGADDGLVFRDVYPDGDGVGASAPSSTCAPLAPGQSDHGGDGDDADGTRYPGAPELCDGDDEDCDGAADDGLPLVWGYSDADDDGWGAAADRAMTARSAP